jgi:hypothetical protein
MGGRSERRPCGRRGNIREQSSAHSTHILRGYEWQPWSDVIADRGAEIGAAMLDFLDRHPIPAVTLSETEGEVAGITYRIRGEGPPLVLMPLSLAPSQWEPVIATLSARYCTISLGGPLLGVVGILEERGRSNYLAMVKNLLDVVGIRPNEVVLEVGGGSGARCRAGRFLLGDAPARPRHSRRGSRAPRRCARQAGAPAKSFHLHPHELVERLARGGALEPV